MDVKSLEHPTLKVPYEILNKKFRSSQKVIDREVNHVSNSLSELETLYTGEEGDTATALSKLDKIKEQLEQLREKSREAVEDVLVTGRVCKRRSEHLSEGCKEGLTRAQEKQFMKLRLERILVEHFLRAGFYESALQLSKSSDICDLVNLEVFLAAKEVEESLNAGDISKCLAWCHENKSKLRKMKSSLEFNVRIQEFIEYIKAGKRLEAVHHARKFLASDDSSQLALVQQVMGLLAFPLNTPVQPYRDLLDQARWQTIVQQFRTENYKLHQLSSISLLNVTLQAGLSSLKTQHCYSQQGQHILAGLPSYMQELKHRNEERNIECPVCHPSLNALAVGLPYSHCSQSRLVCYMSGTLLNENNLPMMLPNGYVYGEQALRSMADLNEGQVVCPRTKEIYSFTEMEKVYVM
ncbi:macrophage erythroblast attacher [Eurytemora carolleeae]|uniref:macrophage erythroblast attacher n=1 Tax=Eurytemora carolleeae TaxID=1294199 RepID=UPI000C782606|nr:macrophage erythroblast attacher [Eurytemora carolleeae]|eukprot:XP_023328951.1 macrophage erythroblast attacher-like [Eurytemora affinis]